MDRQYKIALLIDAENVSKKYIKLIMDELGAYGTITYKRVYGNFETPSVSAWKNVLVEYGMTPVFQFNYTTGKNASDSVMVIDAMDILYSGKVDAFCLITSDSDFTRLAIRLREAGMFVIGMGEQKTPASLVASCETFKYLDLLYDEKQASEEEKTKISIEYTQSKSEPDQPKTELIYNPIYIPMGTIIGPDYERKIPKKEDVTIELLKIVNAHSDENGWINLAVVGNLLSKRVPGFDSRNYGYEKLKNFVESLNEVEMQGVKDPNNKILTIYYIRAK